MPDSYLINTPVSSPIHPQANLPLLKGYLVKRGYDVKAVDTNILFYQWFLQEKDFQLDMSEVYENPLKILEYYNNIERKLRVKAEAYDGLDVGIRHLNLKYDRTTFDGVLATLDDKKANPFIAFYSELVDEWLKEDQPKIVSIAITFQDQLVSAFTLAKTLREKSPSTKIVFGGQMITRCHDTLTKEPHFNPYWDYLSLWEGEVTLELIHRKVIKGESVDFINVIQQGVADPVISRREAAPSAEEIPAALFDDIDFSDYLFPDMLVPLQTTRGCYGACEFCAIPYGANSYRVRKPKDILDDILRIQKETEERFGKKATLFKFMEDTSSPKHLYELSVLIEEHGLDVKWETFARMEKKFTEPGFMEQLYRGGCRKIHWGLESNNPDVLKNMNKKTTVSYSTEVLRRAAEAGVLNFCFILIGFPGETDEQRQGMLDYIANNPDIHTITVTTFDLTRGAPMHLQFNPDNPYKLTMLPPEDFQVRLPYLIDGENWKEIIVKWGHQMMSEVVRLRPDIGFMTLFPDQIRSLYCDRFGNDWGRQFLDRFGEDNIKEMLFNTNRYMKDYEAGKEIDVDMLPEPLRREHFRTKEDLALIARAVMARKKYEGRRTKQV